MKRQMLAAAAALFAFTMTSHAACEGQTGSVIFEDNFADDSGGWELTPNGAAITPPNLVMTLSQTYTNIATQNLTFNAAEGDFCVTGDLPVSIAPDNTIGLGVQFWAKDYGNFFMAFITSSNTVFLYKRVNEAWSKIWEVDNSTAVKPGTSNALRVVARGGKVDVFVNGTEIKAVRAQMPAGASRFGVYAQADKIPNPAQLVNVTGYSVTAGP